MTTIPDLIAQLRAAAEDATKGEWKDEGSYLSTSLGNMLIAASASAKCPRAGDYYECDGPTASPRLFLAKGLATYIVAAQPLNITRILDAYAEMERERNLLRLLLVRYGDKVKMSMAARPEWQECVDAAFSYSAALQQKDKADE